MNIYRVVRRNWRHRASLLLTAGLLLGAACVAYAQTPYPSTAAPQAWGGYPVAQPVPYQPMLADVAPPAVNPIVTTSQPAPVVITPGGPAYTLAAPVVLPSQPVTTTPVPGQVWQPYPEPGAPPPPAPASFPIEGQPSPVPGAWDLRASLTPPDARDGFFQKAKFSATWLPQMNDDGLGWTDLKTEVVTALPFFTRENPIIITPGYTLHLLDRPQGFDLPSRLNDLWLDLHIFRVYDNRWIFDFAVTPGLFADDHSLDSSDACRINGRGVAVYAPNPEWKWLLGVQYVNGAWDKVVPIAGFVYQPNDDVKYEAVFPQPRVAWRLPSSPIPGRDEYWFYLLGEFTTSIWAFEQTDGTPDIFAYRDLRLIVGLERKIIGGLSTRVEAGWAFRRDMKIASLGPNEIGLDDTALVRVGVVY